MRDRLLHALVIFGGGLFVSTELLGAFSSIRRSSLLVFWLAALVCAGGYIVRGRQWRIGLPRIRGDVAVWLACAGCAAILAFTAATAFFSPPNSADAMAYHMPRVIYWAESGSVRFFPTPYLNQIMLQPFAEYPMLQLYVISGSDRFTNLVQWMGFAGSIVAVSSIARFLGASARGEAFAALFCATLPGAILASSGAKNDLFLAMWLTVAVYFALRLRSSGALRDGLFFGAALGFALLTKATAYLFIPWPLAAIFLSGFSRLRARLAIGIAAGVVAALAINTPQYARNLDLSGSVLGFDSAQGDGFFRWRNESFGWRQTGSNLLRNISDELGARSQAWNQGVYRIAMAAHRRLGIDASDPATTWRGSRFGPPVNANHEANAPAKWHLFVLLVSFCLLMGRRGRPADSVRAWYAVALGFSFLAFCAYLKWQPFFARLLVPLLILAAPLACALPECLERLPMRALRQGALVGLCLLLLDGSRAAVFQNWVRPLEGQRSVLAIPRDRQYFADMSQWNTGAEYPQTVERLAGSPCNRIGLDIADFQLEYPLQALLRERKPESEFVHTGVTGPSAKYRQPVSANPCAVVCLDCVNDVKRQELYRGFPRRATIGNFVIFQEAAKASSNSAAVSAPR